MIIRESNDIDIHDLSRLMTQLGYPTTEEEMAIRYNKIKKDPHYLTFVAEVDDKIVGMVGLFKGLFYEKNDISIRIIAFVVDVQYRNLGIGKKLIKHVENWSRNQGALEIGLTSGKREERKAAHYFYKSLGYLDRNIGFIKVFD